MKPILRVRVSSDKSIMIFPKETESIEPIKKRIEKKLELLRIEWKKKTDKRWVLEKQAKFLEIAIFKLDEKDSKSKKYYKSAKKIFSNDKK